MNILDCLSDESISSEIKDNDQLSTQGVQSHLRTKRLVKMNKTNKSNKLVVRTNNNSSSERTKRCHDDVTINNDLDMIRPTSSSSNIHVVEESGSDLNIKRNRRSNEIDYKALWEEAESYNLILQLKCNYFSAKCKDLITAQKQITANLSSLQSSLLDCIGVDDDNDDDDENDSCYDEYLKTDKN